MKLAVIAEYDPSFEPHVQTDRAIADTADALKLKVHAEWISTADDRMNELAGYDAIWFAPGSPYKHLQRTLDSVRLLASMTFRPWEHVAGISTW